MNETTNNLRSIREDPVMSKSLLRGANLMPCPSRSKLESAAPPPHSKRAFSSERLVPQLISEQARQNPGRVALVDEAMQLTYSELEDQANRLAHHLKAMGVVANTVVAVCMRRSPLAVLASLAVLKAGGAYLPIDLNYPRERLSFILTDAHVSLALSESSAADRLPAGSWRVILLDREDVAETTPNGQPSQILPDQLSYVIYTSGSTGTPKGVEITHENLLNLVFWHQKAYAVTAEDRATQFTSFGFDAAVAELWPSLTAGATVHFTPEDVRSSPELLKSWLVTHEITITFVSTALAERLIMLEWPANTKLRLLLTGGDTLHHYPRPGLPFTLINEYGPTETTVVATSGRVLTQPNPDTRPSIGRPIDNTEIYITDESLICVPMGQIGELCIGGAGVARGYVNSPELTASKFVPDPFSTKPNARLYRTGDLARWLPHGEIEFVGRVDNLIKIRGFRVELNEIIVILNTHPGVQASVVVERKNGTENQDLVAYLVLNPSQPCPTATQLRNLLRSRLPDYMIPAIFVELPDLPVNSNGKVDRKALPRPDASNILPDENYLSPRTVLEGKLSRLVANLLGVPQVGVNDNLFLIGGHSLFGTQLIARIRDNFGVELPLRSVFESPTPALLAQEIERLMVTTIEAMSEDEVQNILKQAASGADR
jgi:amino acid adenylation domain-containing protein